MHSYSARLFIAIPIPNRFRPIISTWSKLLQERWRFKRWVHPADLHITIKYLGETDFNTAKRVKERLRYFANMQKPFTLSIDGLSTFGNPTSPRILWAGIQGELGILQQVYEQVEKEMVAIGFKPEDRPYHPHLTLARSFQGESFKKEEIEVAPQPKEEVLRWEVRELVLYQSNLGRTPMYQPLAIFPFSGR
jgi:2'-5' RNA ligase